MRAKLVTLINNPALAVMEFRSNWISDEFLIYRVTTYITRRSWRKFFFVEIAFLNTEGYLSSLQWSGMTSQTCTFNLDEEESSDKLMWIKKSRWIFSVKSGKLMAKLEWRQTTDILVKYAFIILFQCSHCRDIFQEQRLFVNWTSFLFLDFVSKINFVWEKLNSNEMYSSILKGCFYLVELKKPRNFFLYTQSMREVGLYFTLKQRW